jgi:hypothetical protein
MSNFNNLSDLEDLELNSDEEFSLPPSDSDNNDDEVLSNMDDPFLDSQEVFSPAPTNTDDENAWSQAVADIEEDIRQRVGYFITNLSFLLCVVDSFHLLARKSYYVKFKIKLYCFEFCH